MKYFLIVYDRQHGQRRLEEFASDERANALHRRAQLEIEMRDDPNVEVIVMASESIDILRKTHSRYFETLESQLAKAGAAR